MVEEEDATFRDQVADREIDMVLDIKIICRNRSNCRACRRT
jgi:hypothetical protein